MPWYLLALASALFIGFYEISEKKALIKEHSFDFLAAASLLMLFISLPILVYGEVAVLSRSELLLVFIGSIFTVSLYIFAARALRHLDISEFSPLMNLSPLFLFFISWMFLGELPSSINILGILFIVFGAYFLELKKHDWFGPIKRVRENKYVHFIILGMLFAGMSALMDKVILSSGINVDSLYFYKRLITALMLIVISSLFFNGIWDVLRVYKRSFLWVFLAAISYMLADYTYFIAVASPVALVSLVIPVKRTSTIVSTILGGESFGEKHLMHKAIAALIMIFGVFFIIR